MIASTPEARHLLLRLPDGARFTEALSSVLRDHVVLAGWVRATGTLADVELRVVDARTGALGAPRRIEGHAQLVAFEGAIALAGDDPSFGARALLVREGPLGVETFAGELVDARVVAVEVLVTALDQVTATRTAAPSGLGVLATVALTPAAASSSPSLPSLPAAPSPPNASPAPAPSWADAARASDVATKPAQAPRPPPAETPRPAPAPTSHGGSAVMPQKLARPASVDEDDQICPDPGDVVEHFAFGRCEVLKSDGDRLHVRAKDGRIKEIALEMLKVTSLATPDGQTAKHFKLDRRL
jgi:predicted DNA-binding protein with PD1-like motif